MNDTHIGTDFYVSLLEFLLSAKQHLIAIAAEHGLTSIQAATLILLSDRSDCPMKQLGQMFHCDASNVTGIVDGLEHKRLVTRENDSHDRRVKTIAISSAGKQLQQQIVAQLAHDNQYLFAPLSQSETEQFVNIVTKLAQYKKPA